MRKPRLWWETHPKELWTAADWRAARKAGVVPPLRKPHIDPALKLLAEQMPSLATRPGGLYGKPDRSGERRRAADDVLEKFGVKPRRW